MFNSYTSILILYYYNALRVGMCDCMCIYWCAYVQVHEFMIFLETMFQWNNWLTWERERERERERESVCVCVCVCIRQCWKKSIFLPEQWKSVAVLIFYLILGNQVIYGFYVMLEFFYLGKSISIRNNVDTNQFLFSFHIDYHLYLAFCFMMLNQWI